MDRLLDAWVVREVIRPALDVLLLSWLLSRLARTNPLRASACALRGDSSKLLSSASAVLSARPKPNSNSATRTQAKPNRGESLLALMGTSLGAFRVGGGIVVLLMALSMLAAQPGRLRQTPEEAAEAISKEAVAVVPLGIPLLAGPGAISTVIIQMDRGSGLLHKGLVVACIVVVSGLCWILLRNAERVERFVGRIGLNVAIRLFGLVLAAIAVEFIVNGLKQMLPILNG